MQVQTYFRHAQKYVLPRSISCSPSDSRVCSDPKWMKYMVWVIVLVDTLNSTVSAYVAYDYAVTDFGRVDKILKVTPCMCFWLLWTIGRS